MISCRNNVGLNRTFKYFILAIGCIIFYIFIGVISTHKVIDNRLRVLKLHIFLNLRDYLEISDSQVM